MTGTVYYTFFTTFLSSSLPPPPPTPPTPPTLQSLLSSSFTLVRSSAPLRRASDIPSDARQAGGASVSLPLPLTVCLCVFQSVCLSLSLSVSACLYGPFSLPPSHQFGSSYSLHSLTLPPPSLILLPVSPYSIFLSSTFSRPLR